MGDKNHQQAIGLLGGTFDPIHIGHLRPALEISEALSLQQLFLMPNHIAPHKSSSHASAKQRSEMVRLAIQGQVNISVDCRELTRHSPSYTIDTLKEMKIQYPSTPICFIMGMDSLMSFDTWHQWQNILNYCHLIISQRPGWQGQFNHLVQKTVDLHKTSIKQDLHDLPYGKIYFQDTSQLDISSTQIRKLIYNKKSINYLVPEAVNDYIKKHNLYRKNS